MLVEDNGLLDCQLRDCLGDMCSTLSLAEGMLLELAGGEAESITSLDDLGVRLDDPKFCLDDLGVCLDDPRFGLDDLGDLDDRGVCLDDSVVLGVTRTTEDGVLLRFHPDTPSSLSSESERMLKAGFMEEI